MDNSLNICWLLWSRTSLRFFWLFYATSAKVLIWSFFKCLDNNTASIHSPKRTMMVLAADWRRSVGVRITAAWLSVSASPAADVASVRAPPPNPGPCRRHCVSRRRPTDLLVPLALASKWPNLAYMYVSLPPFYVPIPVVYTYESLCVFYEAYQQVRNITVAYLGRGTIRRDFSLC